MQTKIEEVSISRYVEYAVRLYKQVDYLVGESVKESHREFVVNTIWKKALSPKVYYRPEGHDVREKEQTNSTRETREESGKEDEIALIKKLIVKNKDNLDVLRAYALFSDNKRVEQMNPEERKKAIRILGGNGGGK